LKPDRSAGTTALQILEPDFAAKLSDHITRDGEAEACPAAFCLGRKEWFENLVADFLGHART
jgi:hypothetical protein